MFGDLTVTRLASDRYLMIGSPTAIVYYQRWFDRYRDGDGDDPRRDRGLDRLLADRAEGARVLAELVSEDISHQAFPFLSARQMKVGLADALVIRVSFTGELGYEIYTAPEFQVHVLERLRAAGKTHGLQLCGMRALERAAPGKGLRLLGPRVQRRLQSGGGGLGRFVRLDKGDFIGRARRGTHPGRSSRSGASTIFALDDGECRSDGQRTDPGQVARWSGD